MQPDISLWQLDFMFSRKDVPIRLISTSDKYAAEDFLQALCKLGRPAQAKILKPLLMKLDRLKLFDFLPDIDVQQDGNIDNTVGLELVPSAVTPTQQLLMFRTKEWQKVLVILHDMARVDERLELLPAALASRVAPDKRQKLYYMYSSISHIKLLWQSEVQLPSKAYLHLKTRLIQTIINEIKFII